jgi:hypothetical protein
MRHLTAAAAIVAGVVLAACSPDAGDFQSEAEKYIESRGFSEEAGLLRYSDAECEEPESTDEDTRYTCTAMAEDGTQWRFQVEITGGSALRVLVPPEAVSAASGESSVPGATTTVGAATTTGGSATTSASTATGASTTSAATPSTTAAATTTTTTA